MGSTDANQTTVKAIAVEGRSTPPGWAVMQRHLIDLMDRAAVDFVQRYTRPDGTLIWREAWPGMDGSDDGYESFLSFPLFYILGGGEHVHGLARQEWNAITWQFTGYGQVDREFDAYYDWMHHGESYTYTYYLGLADPSHYVDRRRALRFAAMYMGEDPLAPNWDADLKMIRSPINGSKGPRFEMTAEDWVTHRPVLAHYLAPYEDIPGVDRGDPFVVVDWNDDETFARVLKLMNERMVPGDVPLNLNATSLIAHAFLYTGEDKYRQWVLDYLQAWVERTKRNGGIMPDNVGPTGQIGERMNGKWWGGYYGWRWPHGAWIILESTLIAGCNATMLTGDPSWLDLHRSQADLLWSLRVDRLTEKEGTVQVPARYGDQGWFDYRPPIPDHYIRLYFMSQEQEDLARILERFPDREGWRGGPRFGKAGSYSPTAWFAYMQGENRKLVDGFPEKVLQDTCQAVNQRLERIEADEKHPADDWDVHHWQDLNPVLPEGLVQMAMGTPAAVYHGGLLHASVRYFDPCYRRPGLPRHVAALVEKVTPQGILLSLVNTDPLQAHDVLVQAGTFGEHAFTFAEMDAQAGGESNAEGQRGRERREVNDRYLRVCLGPSAHARIHLGMRRYVHRPTYAFPPWGESNAEAQRHPADGNHPPGWGLERRRS